MIEDIISYERRVWDALMTGDATADMSLLHSEFLGVYSDGFSGRDGHVGQLENGPTISSFALSEITVKPLGADHALICYLATFQRSARTTSEQMFVSSIWRQENNGWINIFSQDTPAL